MKVFNTGDRWAPAGIAVCGHAMLCDFCAPREQAKSRDRWGWQFNDWITGGGQLLGVRLSLHHSKGDDAIVLLDLLTRSLARLRQSKAWKKHRIVDWVRVIHARWAPAHQSFNLHFHLVGFIAASHTLDEGQAAADLQDAWAKAVGKTWDWWEAEVARIGPVDDDTAWEHATPLQMAWRDRVARGVGRKVSRRNGLFARLFASGWAALYAWQWADPDERDADTERVDVHRDDLGADYEPRHLDDDEEDGSWPLYRLAEAALAGDRVAVAAWRDLGRAMKGVSVVKGSRMLNKAWKAHEATLPTPEPVEVGPPEVEVHARLWEKARRAGATQRALEVGRTLGVEAMAQWWHDRLGVVIVLEESTPPRLSTRDGPSRPYPSPSLN